MGSTVVALVILGGHCAGTEKKRGTLLSKGLIAIKHNITSGLFPSWPSYCLPENE